MGNKFWWTWILPNLLILTHKDRRRDGLITPNKRETNAQHWSESHQITLFCLESFIIISQKVCLKNKTKIEASMHYYTVILVVPRSAVEHISVWGGGANFVSVTILHHLAWDSYFPQICQMAKAIYPGILKFRQSGARHFPDTYTQNFGPRSRPSEVILCPIKSPWIIAVWFFVYDMIVWNISHC